MGAAAKYRQLLRNAERTYATAIQYLLYAMVGVVVLALVVGIVKAVIDLFSSLQQPLDVILQKVIVDAVFIIALIEISIIILGYLKDGNIRLRYIIDAVLIIMIGETIRAWFRHPSLAQAGSLAIIIITLLIIRFGITYMETAGRKET